ncbi:MAG: helix-turn-helix domain-containing protein [Blastocatellia bacterium]
MATLGQQLKQAREERGITINQIAETTRLGSRFLEALENDDYKILPGGVFNRAFVRKFAHQVGMDEDQAVKLYDQQLADSGGATVKTAYLGLSDEVEARASSSNNTFIAVIVIVLLAALGAGVYFAFFNNQAPDAAPLVVALTPTPAQTPTPMESPSPSPTPEEISGLRIEITANMAECWVSFRTDTNKNEQVTLKLGERREFQANERITFGTIGNLPALKMTINGKPAIIEKLSPGLKGLVATNVIITKDNYKSFTE